MEADGTPSGPAGLPGEICEALRRSLTSGALQCPKAFQALSEKNPKRIHPKDRTSGFVYSLAELKASNWKGIFALNFYLVGFILHFQLMCGEEACDHIPRLHFSCGNHTYKRDLPLPVA